MSRSNKSNLHTGNCREITIDIWPYAAFVVPTVPGLLNCLHYEQLDFHSAESAGIQSQSKRHRLYDKDDRNRVWVSAGMVPRVRERLQQLGYRVIINDHRRFGVEHIPDRQFMSTLSPAECMAAEAMIQNPKGQIEISGNAELVEKIVLAYRLFPGAKIVVATAIKKTAWWLWKQLQRELREPIGLVTSHSSRRIGRCSVYTYKYLNTVDADNCQILLLPDADEIIGRLPGDTLPRLTLNTMRTYAFRQAGGRRSRAEVLKTEAVAGRLIHSPAHAFRSVRVVMSDAFSMPRTSGLHGLKWKRRGYWTNFQRNQQVARIARAMAARNMSALWHLGLLLDQDEQYFGSRIPSVAVLVESPEHAEELRRMLSDWTLTTGKAKRVQPASIITITAASTIRAAALDILVVASGGDAHSQLPWLRHQATAYGTPEVLVIDFQDDFDDQAMALAKQRTNTYLNLGWVFDQHRPIQHQHQYQDAFPADWEDMWSPEADLNSSIAPPDGRMLLTPRPSPAKREQGTRVPLLKGQFPSDPNGSGERVVNVAIHTGPTETSSPGPKPSSADITSGKKTGNGYRPIRSEGKGQKGGADGKHIAP